MTPDQWDKLWNAGIPLVLLAIGIIKIWVTWRQDTEKASIERIANGKLISELSENIKDLKNELSGFFLTHFP